MSYEKDAWTVFWCSLLGPILLDDVPAGERKRFLRALSQREVLLPNGERKHISIRTLQRKVRRFRDQQIDGLRRKNRDDRGAIRRDRQALLDRAVALKREQSRRSPRAINKILSKEFGRTIPTSTMNRHFKRLHVTRRKLGGAPEKIRCRWTRDHSNSLWVGDFSHGPLVTYNDRVIKSHLSIWIDCHSRFVVEGRYYYRENLDILIDSLLRAWGQRGTSRQLYCDNGKVYHANGLQLACTALNIELLHRPPREPSPGGIIERIIQTTQEQFEAEVRAGKILSLSELNRYFQAWLATDYHKTEHSQTNEPPQQRFEAGTRFYRRAELANVREFFHVREERTVDNEFVDVRVNSQFYRVDVKHRGDRLIVSYDPFSGDLTEVHLFSQQGEFLQVAPRYQRERGAHPEPPTPAPQPPLDHHYLDMLLEEHQQQLDQAAENGMDYHAAMHRQHMSLTNLINNVARLLGRRGGLSSLRTDEIELLTLVHTRLPKIHLRHLESAFQRADTKSVAAIVFHLQNLLEEGDA